MPTIHNMNYILDYHCENLEDSLPSTSSLDVTSTFASSISHSGKRKQRRYRFLIQQILYIPISETKKTNFSFISGPRLVTFNLKN